MAGACCRPVHKSGHHHSHSHMQNHNHSQNPGNTHTHTHSHAHHLSIQELEQQEREERGNLNVLLTICLLLSAYLFGAMLLPNDSSHLPHWVSAGPRIWTLP